MEFISGLNEEGFEWFYDFWSKVKITVPDSLRIKGRNDRWNHWYQIIVNLNKIYAIDMSTVIPQRRFDFRSNIC